MLDSINIGTSGLLGYSKGLHVIANNSANLNTPGFKSSSLQFADMFAARSPFGGTGLAQVGYGVNTTGTALNFAQGELRQTGKPLDLAVDGQGLFTLEDSNGQTHYSRAGQFEFNGEGVLVNRGDGFKVMGRAADGARTEISVAKARTNDAKASSVLKFNGNLSSTAVEFMVASIKVIDASGGSHDLSAKLTNTDTTEPGSWAVDVLDEDGTTVVGSGTIVFANAKPVADRSKVVVTYTAAGVEPVELTLDFSADVQSIPGTDPSTLAFASQDGYPPGFLTDTKFDAQGTLIQVYSNGQEVKGAQLLLGRFDTVDAIKSIGGNQFDVTDDLAWHVGTAGDGPFGIVRPGVLEISNVDLSQEFSDLVIMQRGYQASSQIISTANEMLQELFSLRGGK